MLERTSLLFLPWTPDGPGSTRVRSVLDGTTREPLGSVRFPGRPWPAWLRATRIEVLETEDAALLLTLRRPWGLLRLWDVYDAEDRRVGSIYPPSLLDGEGLRRGFLQTDGAIGLRQERLADFEIDGAGSLRIRFGTARETNPYLRMLLLAAGLTLQSP